MGSHHFTEEMEWESLEEDGSRDMVQVKQIEKKFRRFPMLYLSSTQLPCPYCYFFLKRGHMLFSDAYSRIG